jgi:hypothetical protein
MAAAERTYTFRAPGDLGERIRAAGRTLADRPELLDRITYQFALAIARDPARFRAVTGNQSAFMRETMELLVAATEKVLDDEEWAKLYAEAADDVSDEEIEFRRAGRERAARRWLDA